MPRPITRTIVRETPDKDFSFGRKIVVTIEPDTLYLTLGVVGKRDKYRIRWAEIYRQAHVAATMALLYEKAAPRKKRRAKIGARFGR